MSRYLVGRVPNRVSTALYRLELISPTQTRIVPSAYFTNVTEAAAFKAELDRLYQLKPEMATLSAEVTA